MDNSGVPASPSGSQALPEAAFASSPSVSIPNAARAELLERCPVIRAVAPCVAHALWGESKAEKLSTGQKRQARNIAEDIRKAMDREGLLKSGGFTRDELEAKDIDQPLGKRIAGISDPMERRIASALDTAGIPYRHEGDPARTARVSLDFELADGLYIEVKRMHSDRIGRQMAQAENVIAAQGKQAVEFLAQAIEARRAETHSGSVADESAVAKPCAQEPTP